ncbi:TetM/TetW/TetO/TetS family tetracycline resistance ribosomal protection protein [Heyndrickxia oleronia]|uniref:GTP-binding protein n=1 Tax=Heyndrickxia oleronia TaxID=38875 RepID=UPI00203CA89B|nr:TetM/TetW/TetO/TetS family tetracycline resistance ribosomal protection protein [Heyndrickxia oleronia]MCM3236433.1 TetM/TetW/TetO/TetS family tetracycline resistance ribosomal protection protein [Heyndrickxia oleronia]
MQQITIGILAHVDAGKTTFAEQLLFHTKSINHRGRVDHQDAFLDNHAIEKARGITVFADQAIMEYKDSTYYLIDTPGHVDFSPEMERSIQVMDYAIIILSAVEGVEGHTETVWQLLRKHQIPTFFFINKTDRVGADVEKVKKEIRNQLTEHGIDITETYKKDAMSEKLIEFIAERDETLLNLYIDGEYDEGRWKHEMKRMIKDNNIYPIASGSALQDIGILSFLEKLDELTFSDYNSSDSFSGRVYKIRHDSTGARVTFLKALSGTLHVRDVLEYGDQEEKLREKITQIRLYNGATYEIVDQMNAGDLFAVTGLTSAAVGDGLGTIQAKATYETVATLKSKVIYDSSLNHKEVLSYFRMLNDEDPSLNVTWDESLQEIHLHVMGKIQLEVLEQIVKDRFNLSVCFGKPEILYKETIQTIVNGYGHFEPLKHYAEVHLLLEPGHRGSGIIFDNDCHPDDLMVSYQNLVKHYLLEKEHRGILTGTALTDVKITLLTGRAHNKHTGGGDFREATLRALRQGLEKAKNILLEPVYNFKIKIDIEQMGRVLSDIQAAYGHFQPPEMNGNKAVIMGRAPVATFMDYSTILASFTQGKGSISLVFGGYEHCHDEVEVIEKIGYNKNADPEYSSSSIFCSKGQGFSVSWDEAEKMMHALK